MPGCVQVGRGIYGFSAAQIHNGVPPSNIIVGNYCSIAAGFTPLLGVDHRPD